MVSCPPFVNKKRHHCVQRQQHTRKTSSNQKLRGPYSSKPAAVLIAAEELRATVFRAIRDQVDLAALLGDNLGGSLARATPLRDHGAARLLLLLLALGIQAARAGYDSGQEPKKWLEEGDKTHVKLITG